ncbi:MAG: endonuclease/exonuclease/phosphatase family protein [Anaerolineales bacterium]|nr:endonuclease/exonuclease/phosphatase family protein [Anaerolineales bacterium]
MDNKYETTLQKFAAVLGWVYLVGLCLWLGLYLIFGDDIGYLGLINSFAFYYFLPAFIFAILAFLMRRWSLLAVSGAAVVVFLWFWGALFLPRLPRPTVAGETLKVMTYNVEGVVRNRSGDPRNIVDSILHEDPDIVMMQEFTHATARTVRRELSEQYPYQILAPTWDVYGKGVISKYPLTNTGDTLPGNWKGTPQILTLDWQGQEITVINYHFNKSAPGSIAEVDATFANRENLAQILAEAAIQYGEKRPVIATGDSNITPLGEAYKTIHAELQDAWLEAGFGLGHTYPADEFGRNALFSVKWGLPIPQKLIRIDYIFVSDDWVVVNAVRPRNRGGSDHLPVVAEIGLK